jgi:soluble cytochrome b562
LRLSSWSEAIQASVKLTSLNNNYWSNIRYLEIVKKIELAREDSGKLDVAYKLLRRTDINSWLKAIEGAQQITTASYAHKEAQDLIDEGKNKILKYVSNLVEQKQWQEVISVSDRLPDSLNLKGQMQDWVQLASAGSTADLGTVGSLELAISQAKEIPVNSPVYAEAQRLIAVWQTEITAVTTLDEARQLAQTGTLPQLQAAIDKASIVPRNNPKYREVQKEVQTWRAQIETIEDQPILDEARQLALGSNLQAWQSAIERASQISTNRTLYKDAQVEIRIWRSNIQRVEDRPILDQALALANTSNYTAAIEAAGKIDKNRALYEEARGQIRQWQNELRAREYLETAYNLANEATPQSLLSAIRTARKIAPSSELYGQGIDSINRWSSELLSIAQERSNIDLESAIAIAKMIPTETDAYEPAQTQIEIWSRLLPDAQNTTIPILGN